MTAERYFHPVALERDIHFGSLVKARLCGTELVIWRSDDGQIRVWEDRCPHRSIRLSAGRNLGSYIEGAYHGWRFGTDGTVTAIPAEGYAPRPEIRVRTIASTVHAGMVWAKLDDSSAASITWNPRSTSILLRPLPFALPALSVRTALEKLRSIKLIVAPTSDETSFAFGFASPVEDETPAETVRRCNDELSTIRRNLEAGLAA
jgi:nitrite reductase/ring-hydroxylating ferredoxin subunit